MSCVAERLRRRLAGRLPERLAGPAHELVQVAHHRLHVELPGDVAGLHAGDLVLAHVLRLGEPGARIEAEPAQRAALRLVLRDRQVRLRHLRARLLVVDVLELDEGAVAGREEAGGDRLAATVVADLQLDVGRRDLALVGPERPRGGDPEGLLEAGATLHLDRRVEVQIGALYRAAERLVEEALDVLLVVPSPAGGERQRDEEQEEHGAAHAAQSSWRHRNSVRLGALFRRMGYVKRTALAAAVLTAVAAAPAHAAPVIEVDGNHAHRVDDPAVPTRAEIALSGPALAGPSAVSARTHPASEGGAPSTRPSAASSAAST